MISAHVKACFNKAHASYDEAADVQRYAGDKLIALLKPHLSPSPCIIDLGCGTGCVTEKLATNINYGELHAIDIADQLLLRAKERLAPHNIQLQNANFESLSFPDQYFDLLFANLSLHWSTHFESTVATLAAKLKDQGLFAFSIPLIHTFSELRPHFSINAFYDLNTIGGLLQQNNLNILHASEDRQSFQFSSTLEALRSIKNVGANCVSKRKTQGLHGKFKLATPIHHITYQLGFFVAQRQSRL